MIKPSTLNRRDFLKIGSLSGGGLLISIAIPVRISTGTPASRTEIQTLNSFLKIAADNSIIITLSKVEMGQGISTTLAMLLAEGVGLRLEENQL